MILEPYGLDLNHVTDLFLKYDQPEFTGMFLFSVVTHSSTQMPCTDVCLNSCQAVSERVPLFHHILSDLFEGQVSEILLCSQVCMSVLVAATAVMPGKRAQM